MKWSVLIALSTFAFCTHLRAQSAPPALMIQNESGESEPLTISKMEVDVVIHGMVARTRMELTFFNHSGRTLAGDLYFPLPEGSWVSGYALDINGKMVDGVVIEKDRGRQVFEKIVRQNIDPGLVEWVGGNNFKTRVFPIPSRGTRTVRVEYVSELISNKEANNYVLPLSFDKIIEDVSLRVEVVQGRLAPQIASGRLHKFEFEKWRSSYVASTRLSRVQLSEDLLIALPHSSTPNAMVEQSEDGNYYFAIWDTPHVPSLPPRTAPKHVAIYWDASGSRGDVSHKEELGILRKVLEPWSAAGLIVELFLFRNRVEAPRRYVVKNGSVEALMSTLEEVEYDGGTSLGALLPADQNTLPDLYLLFSDGLSNFGEKQETAFERPVFVFSGDTKSNHSYLRYLAAKSKGAYFNLKRHTATDVLPRIQKQTFSFLSHNSPNGAIAEAYPNTPEPVVKRTLFVGKLRWNQTKVTLNFGTGGVVSKSTTHPIARSGATKGELLRVFWAQKKIDALSSLPRQNKLEILKTGQQHGLVTPGTSLIVLDNLNQYVEHKVRPPASSPDMRAQYDSLVEKERKAALSSRKDKIQKVIKLWKKRVKWWKTEFKPRAAEKKRAAFRAEPEQALAALTGTGRGGGGSSFGFADLAQTRSRYSHAASRVAVEMSVSEKPQPPGPSIALSPWNPDTPYLKKLNKAPSHSRLGIYLDERRKNAKTPSFYLDCADFFFGKSQTDLAVRVLSNIAELELENPALLRVLAHRLAQQDMLDLSIPLFEEVLRLRPEEPQSYRDLALVIARRAQNNPKRAPRDYARAIELLYKIVTEQWDRFDEIEVIALMEINRLIPKAKRAGVHRFPIHSALIKNLQLDVRIVLTWDADLTDLDLWVTEPSGEKAMYSNALTTIGGLVSRDYTDGLGPEEYCLKKAIKGPYKIETNYYGSSAQELLGAVTLQVEIYTDYGRRTERRKAVTLRLTQTKDVVPVSEITF